MTIAPADLSSVDTAPSVLARRNPLAAMAACAAVSIAALVATDPLTPALLLLGTLLAVPFAGLTPRRLALRLAPLAVGAVGIALSNAMYGKVDATTAFGLGLRVAALALPGVLVLGAVDPTELADALVQRLRAPARFAYGALAAIRMLPLLAAEWQTIGLARRARGIDAGRNPVAAVRLLGGRVFTLFVGALRRASRLAVAMDARGFDAGHPRTFARRSELTWADAALVAAGVALALGATLISVAVGSWRFLTGV